MSFVHAIERSFHALLAQENDTSWESWDTIMDTVMHIIGYVLLLEQCLDAARSAVAFNTAFLEAKEKAMGISIISSERRFKLDPVFILEHRDFIKDRLFNGFLPFHHDLDK